MKSLVTFFLPNYWEVAVVCCWLVRGKARVRAPSQALKRNMKKNYISSTIYSRQISGQNSETRKLLPWKFSQPICRSEPTLNCRFRHLCIKLTHTTYLRSERKKIKKEKKERKERKKIKKEKKERKERKKRKKEKKDCNPN